MELCELRSAPHLTRAAVINVLSFPFIEMAILKGLREYRLFLYHALPHALGPIMNAVILGIANLVVGVIIVEIVFAYPGIGQLLVDAVRLRDVPVVQVCGLIFTVTYITLTFFADLVVILSNPRIAAQQLSMTKTRLYKKEKQMRIRRAIAIGTLFGVFVIGIIFGSYYLRNYRLQHIDPEIIPNVSHLNTVHRGRFTADELFADTYKGDSPVQNDYFMPTKDAGPALHAFSGTLSIESTKMSHRLIWAKENVSSFPALKINFFTYKEHLVPVDRNKLLKGEGSTWNIILASGRIWSEPADNGYSRASFPFTLIPSKSNFGQTHNGIATFLFNEKRVSQLRFQIVQEAAPENKFDAWGQAGMNYRPTPLQDQILLTQEFAKELAHQTPIRTWAELEQAYDPIMLDMIDETNNRENITLSGLIIDDAVYARPCRTRWGDYPYCGQMRHGVYSISKSLGAMLAMLRLAQKYGDGVFDLKIKDYVDIASNHDGWREVTFGDTLNMATGIGDMEPRRVSGYVSEGSTALARRIYKTQTTNEKLKLIAAFGNYPWEPGEVFRYRTSDTFVLAVAMDRFIKSKEGQNADLWSLITREVFQPIGIAHMPVLHTIERNHARGIPMLGIGMLPTLGEVAKLVKLLRNGGQHKGEQILSAKMLDEAIGKAMSPGLPTGWQLDDGETYYNMSLWLHPYRAKDGCFLRICPANTGSLKI